MFVCNVFNQRYNFFQQALINIVYILRAINCAISIRAVVERVKVLRAKPSSHHRLSAGIVQG